MDRKHCSQKPFFDTILKSANLKKLKALNLNGKMYSSVWIKNVN